MRGGWLELLWQNFVNIHIIIFKEVIWPLKSRLAQCGVCRVDLRSIQAGQVGEFQFLISYVKCCYSEFGEATPICREDGGGGGEVEGEEEGPWHWFWGPGRGILLISLPWHHWPWGPGHLGSSHWSWGGGGHSLGAQDDQESQSGVRLFRGTMVVFAEC